MSTPGTAPGSATGRFAPSPTGPLHFGSLVAAVGSFLQARRHGGRWLVRIEDLDPPREAAGAADAILRTLDAYGLHWDGEVLYQSTREAAYRAAFDTLRQLGAVYPCGCTRQEIAQSARRAGGEARYPGTCRGGLSRGRRPRAWRLNTVGQSVRFTDAVQGLRVCDLERESGDFVVLRADGLFAYQLAVVVDDAAQGITQVVRGSDLLDSTPRQILLQRSLGLPTPAYLHLPVATAPGGAKLSKQTGAPALDDRAPQSALRAALEFLGHPVPAPLRRAPPEEFWAWALEHWDPARIPRVPGAPAPADDGRDRGAPRR